MSSPDTNTLSRRWVPDLPQQVWILAAGQLLLFIGQGVTLVYAAIYFVDQLGFSPAQVGLAQGSMGLTGVLGRVWAGSAVDSRLGRRGTLLLATAFAALGSLVFAGAQTLVLLVAGNLLLGLSSSLYWPATLTMITDLTAPEQRTDAMAVTRLADNLGLGLGALLAGQYIAMSGRYPLLFVGKAIAYGIFGVIIWNAIAETRPSRSQPPPILQAWGKALQDRHLTTFLVGNLFFTIGIAQVSSTLPLYLTRVPAVPLSTQAVSYVFAWHALLKIGLQLPVAKLLRRVAYPTAMLSALALWGSGTLFIWLMGVLPAIPAGPWGETLPLMWGLTAIAFAVVAVAEITYGPASTAFVAALAPTAQRGVYFALESQSWSVGFLLGPVVGGWALNQPARTGLSWPTTLWLGLAVAAAIAAAILGQLQGVGPSPHPQDPMAENNIGPK